VLNYDRIFVLDNGKVVQKGTPKQLISEKGLFLEMIGNKLDEFEKIIK
jgi:ABC-type multidrug transport system fused ATPase/permease subunit